MFAVDYDFEVLSAEGPSSENNGNDDVEDDLMLRLQRIHLKDRTICQPDLPHTVSLKYAFNWNKNYFSFTEN